MSEDIILRPNRDQLRKIQLQGLRLVMEPATRACPNYTHFSMHMSAYFFKTPFRSNVDAILASSPGIFDLSDIFWVRKRRFTDVGYLIYKKAGGKNCRGTCQMRCARRHARGQKLQRYRHRLGYMAVYNISDINVVTSSLFCWKLHEAFSFNSFVPSKNYTAMIYIKMEL